MKGNWFKTCLLNIRTQNLWRKLCLRHRFWYWFLIMPSLLLQLSVLLPVNAVWAIPISDIPNPRQLNGTWVSDVADILSPETEAQLNQRINRLVDKNGSEIAVVTVPNTAPAITVKSYATELFNTWGIGKRGIDNGVLFLIAVKERRLEIETGRGITPYISDRQVAQVIKDLITPEFKRQNFDRGIINGVEEMAGRIEKINFYPFPFTPIYSSLGIVGIAIAISGGILCNKKIQEWVQKLPTIEPNFQNPVVFQVKIPQLEEFANLEMWLMGSGLVALSISTNAWILSQEAWTNLFINPFNQFIATLLVNLIIAIATLPLWLGLERVWLKQLAQVFGYPIQRYEVDQVNILLLRKSYLILVFHLPALAIAWLLGNTAILLTIPTHLIFSITSLLIALGYQFWEMSLVDHMYLDTQPAKDSFFCQTCRQRTQKLTDEMVHQYLKKPELSAVELGNATYDLYYCDHCHPLTTTTNRKKFRNHIYCHPHIQDEVICPRCSYPTVIRVTPKQTRKSKKFPKQGSQEATAILQCQNCFHEEPVYPYVAPVSSSSYFSDYNSSYDSSSSSSSYDSYDYGSSSSSSDFGGGGSDGGGAGSDW